MSFCVSVIPSGAFYAARTRFPTPAFDSTGLRHVTPTSVADPGFAKGADHGERLECKPINWGLGAEPKGRAEHLVGGRGDRAKPPEVESFLSIFIQKVAKT